MRRSRRLGVLLVLLLCASGFGLSACHPPASVVTPAGSIAYRTTQVVRVLDVIRDVAIAANAETPPVLSTATTKAIVQWHQTALTLIQAAQAGGWQAAVKDGLRTVQGLLSAPEHSRFDPYFSLASSLIDAVAP